MRVLFIPIIVVFLLVFSVQSCQKTGVVFTTTPQDMTFDSLATHWDEGVPLGNGILGALVWKKGEKLRFSIDRVDLWDVRPMDNIDSSIWRFDWVYEQWNNNQYGAVQQAFDVPYDRDPTPSKIPAGAIEFPIEKLGEVNQVRLAIQHGVCEIKWENGTKMVTFINTTQEAGWFSFEGVTEDFKPTFTAPKYGFDPSVDTLPLIGLQRLQYESGEMETQEQSLTYTQKGWGGFYYQVFITWKYENRSLTGCWSISSHYPDLEGKTTAEEIVNKEFKKGIGKSWQAHRAEWNRFWEQSNISIPDTVIEKQWYWEQYKFKSAACKNGPPISLQAIWTADNGNLPPWKGDFHHDLNTQLSYWPAYSGNHLNLAAGYTTWLWNHMNTFKKYTKTYFGTNGVNLPGVSTLRGESMGGWIQYAFGPTVSAWMSHHFYLQWRYSMDREFLKTRAYPWIKETAIYLEEFSKIGADGKRKLPLSSSPEINNNNRDAWFSTMTNFDLALIRFTFEKAGELALELGLKEESTHWFTILAQWPDLCSDSSGLLFAKDFPYTESHRHFSHAMAIHPLGLLDMSNTKEKEIILNTINTLEKHGSLEWVGYSFSWMACMQARIGNGEKAAQNLKIFAENFCLMNSFHVNGEQHNRGYTNHKYKPFTLEGNFAFASALQEMLIQSQTGVVKVFPAIPKSWETLSFHQLRTEGAFLVSAQMEKGKVVKVRVLSEKGGTIKLLNPFDTKFTCNHKYSIHNKIIEMVLEEGDLVILSLKR